MPAGSRLAVVGNLNADLWVQTVERFPRWDEELLVESARIELAGTAGYVLLACKGLGMSAFAVSTLGDDAFGQYVHASVEALGFETEGVEVLPGRQTSLGMIFIDPAGRRSILSTLGAHSEMDMEVVARHEAAIAGCTDVLICGSYLLPGLSPADVLPLARECRQRGQTVAFDPSWDPAGWGERTRRDTYELLREVDVYLPNEEELTHLTGQGDWPSALREVEGLAGEVVLKRGSEGAVFARDGERVSAPALPIAAVNTVGAGDVFDTAYLYARRQDWPPARRLQFACTLAGMVVSQPGTREYPSADAVEARRNSHHR